MRRASRPRPWARSFAVLLAAAGLAAPGGGVRAAGPAAVAPARLPSSGTAADPPDAQATRLMNEGYQRKAAGDLAAAESAFEAARAAGFDPQRIRLELGYLAAQRGDGRAARSHFEAALHGQDPRLVSQARSELSESWMHEALERKSRDDFAAARQALYAARAVGSDVQRTELELAYVAIGERETDEARRHLAMASAGSDPALSSMAQKQLSLLGSDFRGDLYADVYGWDRRYGGNPSRDAVPTFRLRGHYGLSSGGDLSLYLYARVTRDVSSAGLAAGGVPLVLADNYALIGEGIQLLVWQRRLGFYLQAGPALNLLNDGKSRTAFDARGGAFLGLETSGCWPAPASGVSFGFTPCAELYSELTYVSRFDHNVVGFARGRAAATWLETGPLAWQLAGELRLAADRNHDFYNNFAEAAVGPRLRLLRPFRLDVFPSLCAGRYLGVAGRDPLPQQLRYVDLRLQAVTYLEF